MLANKAIINSSKNSAILQNTTLNSLGKTTTTSLMKGFDCGSPFLKIKKQVEVLILIYAYKHM